MQQTGLGFRKEAEDDEALIRAQHMHTVGILACGLVHDFKNALTAMMGNAELLRLESAAAQNRRIDSILTAGWRAVDLASSLLSVGDDGAGEKGCKADHVLQEAMRLVTSSLPHKARFKLVHVEKNLPVTLPAVEVFQIAFNILLNAVDAGPPSREVEVLMEASGQGAGTQSGVLLTVRDRGVGMTEEELQRALQPFCTTKSGGCGLGLPTVKALVDRAGGHLDIQSVPGRGTTVQILLPRRMAPPSASITEGVDEELPCPPGGRILFLDAHEMASTALTLLAERSGYDARRFARGDELLRHLASEGNAADLVILDEHPRDMGLTDLCQSIRERHPDLPLVVAMLSVDHDAHVKDLCARGLISQLREKARLVFAFHGQGER